MPTNTISNYGLSLKDLSKEKKLLVVFLRHFGCTFCREAMSEIEKQKNQIKELGFDIVLVHMKSLNYGHQIFKIYGLDDVIQISDPEKKLYQFFGLEKGSINQLFGVPVWFRSIVAGLFKGHLIGQPQGDPYQMPGVFIFENNKVIKSFKHIYVSDQVNYLEFVSSISEELA